MITKGELVDLVYLKVHSGQPSSDVNIRKADIESLMVPAINYVLTAEMRQRRVEEAQISGNTNDTGVDETFIATYYADVKEDTERALRYIDMPAKVQSFPGNRGLVQISGLQSPKPYQKMAHQFHDNGIEMAFGDLIRYWYERVTINNEGLDERVFFKNIPPTTEKVMIRMVVSSDDLGDDDLLPIPDGSEIKVMEYMVEWFMGQRQLPADDLNNNKDDIHR